MRVEVWCDGKALHLRKVLEGPELRNKLGVERLVGEEAVIDITGSELKDMAGALGLSETEVERLTSGETVEVYLGASSETCTDGPDPWYNYPPYSYPRYSWARYGSSQTGFYYCVADPINLLWEKSSGDLYPYAVETTFTGHGWGYTWFGNPNYVYDPIYGWKPDEYSLKKDYPGTSYYRYHVRLWKVHKGGYGKVVTVGQAHVDTCPPHEAVLYEEAEDKASEALACGLHNCPIFLVDLGRLLQPIVCLIWLEALLAASSGWLMGRPLMSFALGSLALFSAVSSPYLGPGLPLLPVLGISEFLCRVPGSPLFRIATALSLAWGLGAAVASGLLGGRLRPCGPRGSRRGPIHVRAYGGLTLVEKECVTGA